MFSSIPNTDDWVILTQYDSQEKISLVHKIRVRFLADIYAVFFVSEINGHLWSYMYSLVNNITNFS